MKLTSAGGHHADTAGSTAVSLLQGSRFDPELGLLPEQSFACWVVVGRLARLNCPQGANYLAVELKIISCWKYICNGEYLLSCTTQDLM